MTFAMILLLEKVHSIAHNIDLAFKLSYIHRKNNSKLRDNISEKLKVYATGLKEAELNNTVKEVKQLCRKKQIFNTRKSVEKQRKLQKKLKQKKKVKIKL